MRFLHLFKSAHGRGISQEGDRPVGCLLPIETDELLEVHNLTVRYETPAIATRPALDGVQFSLPKGQCAVILGESGSGKTTLARAIVRLLPSTGRVVEGRVVFCGNDLTSLPERQMQHIRGAGIAMMLQEPLFALNPAIRALDQVIEVLRAHSRENREKHKHRAKQILEKVRLSGDYNVEQAYPHEMSGGERQRLLLGMSLASKPSLLIADEPTSAVDDGTRTAINEGLKQARDEYGLSVLWITHDPQEVTALADRVLVFYAGELIEDAPAEDLMERPFHPYTRLLLAAAPPPLGVSRTGDKRLAVFPGPIADSGCRFAPRCPERLPSCLEQQPLLIRISNDRCVRCLRYVH
jgi:peptide/nickel transport system ATP-binding protein